MILNVMSNRFLSFKLNSQRQTCF